MLPLTLPTCVPENDGLFPALPATPFPATRDQEPQSRSHAPGQLISELKWDWTGLIYPLVLPSNA